MERYLKDREPINTIWGQLFEVRQQLAANAGFDNYRSYIWQARHRYDYTPEDCLTFHAAIEKAVLPAARRRNERRREKLGLEKLRPWDLSVDPEGRTPIKPWQTIDDFADKAEAIFNQVDPHLGRILHHPPSGRFARFA
jgi:oligoendopeptidase F